MILSTKVNLLYCVPLENGQYNVGMTPTQAKDFIEALNDFIAADDMQMVHWRTKFFDEEGYMESDEVIKLKYGVE